MGEVFLAEDAELERPVALKVMSAESAGDPIQRKRFRAEARAASALSHPNICATYEVGETGDGRPFIALEYVEGQTLDLARQQQRLAIPDIVEIGIQVAEALEAAHARHLVHRDVKPANIMLDRRGRVKVMDFGLAKQHVVDPPAPGASSLLSTQTGVILGTPHYMSPEQALGREVDHRTDLFSLGVVLYELVAWQKPFLGSTVGETINNVVNRQPDPLTSLNRPCPPALEQIILRCLEKEPDRRYATARELAQTLRELQDRLTAERATRRTTARRPCPRPRRRSRRILLVLLPKASMRRAAAGFCWPARCPSCWLAVGRWPGGPSDRAAPACRPKPIRAASPSPCCRSTTSAAKRTPTT